MDTSLDHALYSRVGLTLLIGLLIAIVVMVAGLLAVAVTGGEACVLPLDQVLPHLTHGRGTCSAGGAPTKPGGTAAAILDLGILLLFATPLVGVFVAAVGFARERDWLFTGTTAVLLAMLVVAFVVALH